MRNDEPASKSELLRLQREGRARWEALIAQVPPGRVGESGVKGQRSVKDIVAHLAAWERHAAQRLQRAAGGGTPEPPLAEGMTWKDFEYAFNAEVDAAWRDRSWEDVRAEAAAAYREFMAAADAVSNETLFDPARPAWPTVAFNGYLHYAEYEDVLRRWLDQAAADSANG